MFTPHRVKKLVGVVGVFGIIGMFGMSGANAAASAMIGGKHDLDGVGTGEICISCHAPHDTATDGPLWNHEMTAVDTYLAYDSDTIDMTINDPGAVSTLCLSCHDGTVATDNFGGTTTGTNFVGAAYVVGDATTVADTNDLTTEHPIGVVYSVTDDAAFEAITDGSVGVLPLYSTGTRVECATCHDPHASTTALLRVDNSTNSALCTTCHKK